MKKILAVLLVLTLLCGCAAAALAADNAPAADEEDYYDALERADRAAARAQSSRPFPAASAQVRAEIPTLRWITPQTAIRRSPCW